MLLPDIGFPQTNKIVEKGFYVCLNCPHNQADDKSIAIITTKDKLPKCPICGVTYWMKV